VACHVQPNEVGPVVHARTGHLGAGPRGASTWLGGLIGQDLGDVARGDHLGAQRGHVGDVTLGAC
jgi:hypothetical protein